MSDVRTMTAAELAADTEEARAVWAAVARGEAMVTANCGKRGHRSVKTVTFVANTVSGPVYDIHLHNGKFLLWRSADFPLNIFTDSKPSELPSMPTYAELEAALARVNAVLATWPDHPRTVSTFVSVADCAAYMAKYDARREIEAAIKGK